MRLRISGPLVLFILFVGLLFLSCVVCDSSNPKGAGAYMGSGGFVPVDKVKQPVTASVGVAQRKGYVLFSLSLCDAGGKSIRHLQTSRGRPSPPKVKVFDALGDQVYSCAMEYG